MNMLRTALVACCLLLTFSLLTSCKKGTHIKTCPAPKNWKQKGKLRRKDLIGNWKITFEKDYQRFDDLVWPTSSHNLAKTFNVSIQVKGRKIEMALPNQHLLTLKKRKKKKGVFTATLKGIYDGKTHGGRTEWAKIMIRRWRAGNCRVYGLLLCKNKAYVSIWKMVPAKRSKLCDIGSSSKKQIDKIYKLINTTRIVTSV